MIVINITYGKMLFVLNKFDRKQDFKRDIDVVMLSCCISIFGFLK